MRRRTFLKDAAKKAAYVTPAVWVLTASRAHAADGAACVPDGGQCNVESDRCSGRCPGRHLAPESSSARIHASPGIVLRFAP